MSFNYRISFSRKYGNKANDTLVVVGCYDYEEYEYALASRKSFDEETDAVEYAKELANKHGLGLSLPTGYHNYLN